MPTASSSSRRTRSSMGSVRRAAKQENRRERRRQRMMVAKIQNSAHQLEIDGDSSDPQALSGTSLAAFSAHLASTRTVSGQSEWSDTLRGRLPAELWSSILCYLDVAQLKDLRAHTGLRDLIDANQEAIVRRTIDTELSRLGKKTEQVNSQPPEFVRALRQWLDRYGVCEKCYSATHYDDLAAFVWHWFSRRTFTRMTEQLNREDFNSVSTACRYIIALEMMPLEPNQVKRVALTRQYSDQLHRILLRRQDWFALQGMDQVNALLERLEDQPGPYPEDLCCGGRHIVEPMSQHRRNRPQDYVPLVPLRNAAKISSYEQDADREHALQRISDVLGIPLLMESTAATYFAPTDATWVKEIIDRILMGEENLKLEALQRAQILEAIIIA